MENHQPLLKIIQRPKSNLKVLSLSFLKWKMESKQRLSACLNVEEESKQIYACLNVKEESKQIQACLNVEEERKQIQACLNVEEESLRDYFIPQFNSNQVPQFDVSKETHTINMFEGQTWICQSEKVTLSLTAQVNTCHTSFLKKYVSPGAKMIELLPHDIINFQETVRVAFKVPVSTKQAILFIQKNNQQEKTLDLYEATPGVCLNGYFYQNLTSFSFAFIDIDAKEEFEILETHEENDVKNLTFKKIVQGLNIVIQRDKNCSCPDGLQTINLGLVKVNFVSLKDKFCDCGAKLLRGRIKRIIFMQAKFKIKYQLEDDEEIGDQIVEKEVIGNNIYVIGNSDTKKYAKLKVNVQESRQEPQGEIVKEPAYIQINPDCSLGQILRAKKKLSENKAILGEINFSLSWSDGNDLDLHVFCPCGNHIFYQMRKCNICIGELDIDMNAGGTSSTEPVENIYFIKKRPGIYKCQVNYFAQHQGPAESSYILAIQFNGKITSIHEGKVSLTKRNSFYPLIV